MIDYVVEARKWYEYEERHFTTWTNARNPYAHAVPVEVRDYCVHQRYYGRIPLFTETHFALWAALLEIMKQDRFDTPLAIDKEVAITHLVGAIPQEAYP